MENPCAEIAEEICHCCGEVITPYTVAEALIDLAESVLLSRNQLICVPPITEEMKDKISHELGTARVALALKFYARRNELMVSAVVEGWDIARIVRELY